MTSPTPLLSGSHCAGIGCAHDQLSERPTDPESIEHDPSGDGTERDGTRSSAPAVALTARHRRSTTGRRRIG